MLLKIEKIAHRDVFLDMIDNLKVYLCALVSLLTLVSCQKKSDQDNPAYTLPYKEYLKVGNFVYIHGETANPDSLGEDKYLEDNLNYVLQNNEWVTVNFSAYWCKDCRKIDPDYRSIAQMPKYKNIVFASAEIDGTKGNENFRQRFQLPGIPATILFHKGHIVEENGEKGILFGQRGDKTKKDLLFLLDKFYHPAS